MRAHLFKASISLVHRAEKSLRTGTAEAATELDTMPRLSEPPWLVASAALTNAMSEPKCCISVSSTYAAVQDTSCSCTLTTASFTAVCVQACAYNRQGTADRILGS